MTSYLYSPTSVTIAGAAVLAGTPWLQHTLGGWSTSAIQCGTILAFVTNVISVSIPGRLDGKRDQQMRESLLRNDHAATTTTNGTNVYTTTGTNIYNERSLVTPSGWAFAIWGPIYLGEAYLCGIGQFFSISQAELTQMSAPFIAANIIQSLWCASFRPSYFDDDANHWKKFVSVMMLGGTAYSLSMIGDMSINNYTLLPITVHFGWTTAATLVNFNSSLSSMKNVSDSWLIAAGHSAVVIATSIGCYVTMMQSLPTYGLTIAWALAACSTGALKTSDNDLFVRASQVQQKLCFIGSLACFITALYTWFA